LHFKAQARQPGACVPWEQKKLELPAIVGDETLARRTWEMVDGLDFGFCWVNLTW
jgi:hypothetical protein